jgi:ketopantoate reductase
VGKFAAISAVGVLASARRPLRPLLACPERRAFVRDTVAEAVAVGRAAGVRLPGAYPPDV